MFNFPFYPGVWQRWLAMSAALVVVAQVVIPCLRLLGVLDDAGASGGMILGLVMGVPSLLLILIGVGYVSACLLAVIEDTANGCDQVQEWPESDWRDWAWTLRLPLVAGFGSLLAASAMKQLTGQWNLVAGLPAMVVFPIMVLSMLESGSAAAPISGAILKSCLRFRGAWLLFYAETAPILLVLTWVYRFAAPKNLTVALLIDAPLTIAVLLIYSRLMGRLAWTTAWGEEEPDEDAEPDTEEAASL